jgi:hypothetical protein
MEVLVPVIPARGYGRTDAGSQSNPGANMNKPTKNPDRLKDRSDDAGDDITDYRDRPSDDGKKGQKANRSDAAAAQSSLGNFAGEDLQSERPSEK